eukprot:15336276-Ditylum_brightwellii.AAC.1
MNLGDLPKEWEIEFPLAPIPFTSSLETKCPTIRWQRMLDLLLTYSPLPKRTHRTKISVGGNLVDYPCTVKTPTADIETAKLLLNSVISMPNAKKIGIDIKEFYLNTPMTDFEYMRFPIELIPEEIMQQHNIQVIAHKRHVCAEIRKGMYRLPQAGRIAHEKLVKHLKNCGYSPCKFTPGLWQHEHRDIVVCCVVDGFGVEYTKKEDVEHLISALQEAYKCTIDWAGKVFFGISLKWNYCQRTVELFLPGYIEKALLCFN